LYYVIYGPDFFNCVTLADVCQAQGVSPRSLRYLLDELSKRFGLRRNAFAAASEMSQERISEKEAQDEENSIAASPQL
jgi:hypothetical protein